MCARVQPLDPSPFNTLDLLKRQCNYNELFLLNVVDCMPAFHLQVNRQVKRPGVWRWVLFVTCDADTGSDTVHLWGEGNVPPINHCR